MRRGKILLVIGLVLVGCKSKDVGTTEYGPNHALVDDGTNKYKKDCLECHSSGEKVFKFAGTVWSDQNGNVLSGVKVVIKSTTGMDSLVLTTDAYGNFYTNSAVSSSNYQAYVDCGKLLMMSTHPTYGGCNSCHRPGGSAGKVIYCK